jgi:hypothetical protein
MVNPNQIITDFRLADAQAILDQFQFSEMQYQGVFPELFRTNLSWKSIEAATGAKVAADVVAMNSRAPRKGRMSPGKMTGDMPKIEVARDLIETDLNTLRELQNAAAQVQGQAAQGQIMAQIINLMYGDAPFVVDGVRARLEWIAKQIASTGKYSLTVVNNEAGIQTKTEVDFGIPTGNKVNAAKDWFTDSTADPITDIENRQKAARLKGKILRFMFMDRDTFNAMAANDVIQKFTASFASNALALQLRPDVATINAALTRQGLPIIVIWDSFVALEGKDGAQTAVSGWEAGKVTFSESSTLGSTQYTLSADEFVSGGTAVKTKSGIVLVKTWGLEDPITVVTKGTAYATPVLSNVNSLYILSTKLA